MSGFTGTFVEITKTDNTFVGKDFITGDVVDINDINSVTMSKALSAGRLLGEYITTTGKTQWRQVDTNDDVVAQFKNTTNLRERASAGTLGHSDFMMFIHNSYVVKPAGLKMTELKWRYLIRSALRGRNIMMTGPAGSGKTLAVKSLAQALPNRPFFSFNLGSTQDPRSVLIGNTMANTDGTFFKESAFIRAIQTKNAIILMDELTRAHPEAWNILMTVLDQGQRYVRLDEHEDSPIIKVAEGVSFIATANIGIEYTATRVLDQAIRDRFIVIEIDVLDEKEEKDLLSMMFPDVDKSVIQAIAKIADETRRQARNGDGKLTKMISTRTNVEAAGLLHDGFMLTEVAEIAFYPIFDSEGDERTYVKQLVQKYADLDKTPSELFKG